MVGVGLMVGVVLSMSDAVVQSKILNLEVCALVSRLYLFL